jgi:hypothetical protein
MSKVPGPAAATPAAARALPFPPATGHSARHTATIMSRITPLIRTSFFALLVAAVAAGGCRPDTGANGAAPDTPPAGDVADAGESPADPSRPDRGETDPEDPDPAFEGTTGPTEHDVDRVGPITIDEVRASSRDGYDRVVFELREGEMPAYTLEYLDGPARECGSGREVTLEGDAILRIQMHPARMHEEVGGERQLTVEDRDRTYGHDRLRHLKVICDHHAGVEWALGLTGQHPYRVVTLDDPPRLVVDVRDSG